MRTRALWALLLLFSPATAGAEWGEQTSIMSNTSLVMRLSAVDETHAFAAGSMDLSGSQYGVVLSTTDGASWTQVYQGSNALIGGLWFESASSGYIGGLTIDGSTFQMAPFIQRTSDGGTSFTPCEVPSSGAYFDEAMVMDIVFTSAGTGWAVVATGALWRSDDGGTTWIEASVPVEGATVASAHFLDDERGWLIGHTGGGDGGGPPSGMVLRTTDGGDSWQASITDVAAQLSAAHFFNGDHGIVVGSEQHEGRIYTTADGGETLQQVALPTDAEGRTPNLISDVTAPCANQAWAVGAIYTDASGETGISSILFSEDGGQTWSLDPWPQEVAESMWDLWQYHTLMTVAFAGPDTGWTGGSELSVVGYDGNGMDCIPPEDAPFLGGGDEDGEGGCDCDVRGERAGPDVLGLTLLLLLLFARRICL